MSRARAVAACAVTAAAITLGGACGGGTSGPGPTRTVTATAPTVTVTAGGTSETTGESAQSRYLNELDPLTATEGIDTGTAEINGTGFASSVTLACNAAGPVNSAEYNLGRHWTTFTATAGLRDDSPTGGSLTFEVAVDGTRRFRETIRLGASREVRLDIRNALRLKLTVSYTGQDASSVYYGSWGDAQITGGKP
ncbi:NPCBM/NEW2 domain-containing protein [Streptomyces griseosporeus]|uniref:NPCBM/NEW2 domain-containing protein n=1 Tax=Streptomyces griseosporeus TaxID=1910 RepID=UPI00167D15DA|nr:NPCBM/NEW2 domain-containing protein [Streptomyces griseosporeus]GHF38558.1 hypothetical protein GCM10018783_03730 [Streptomyces griseosporeus]